MLTAQAFFQWSYVSGQWGQISSDLLQHIALACSASGWALCFHNPLLYWRGAFVFSHSRGRTCERAVRHSLIGALRHTRAAHRLRRFLPHSIDRAGRVHAT